MSKNYLDKSGLSYFWSKLKTILNGKANTSDLATKQDTLVSGTNIKTINNESLLGSGNIVLSADDEVAISTTQPTGNETVWIKSDETTNQARYKDGNTWKNLSIKALDSMSIGSIILFAGETIPTGWLICDGDTLNEEEYPELYDVIRYKYGGSGTSFNLPNLKGRVPVGLDTTQTEFDTLGETGGSKYLQMHNHYVEGAGNVYYAEGGTPMWINRPDVQTGYRTGTSNTGNGQSGNLQPYLVVNYIIKATNTTPTMASVVNATNNSTVDTYSCDYVNNLQPIELYNSNGSSTEITLSDTTANYSYIEIFGNTNGNWSSIKIPNPNGKIFEPSVRYIAGTQLVFILATYNINGTKITPDTTKCGYATINNNGVVNFNYDQTNYFYITKVIGYK